MSHYIPRDTYETLIEKLGETTSGAGHDRSYVVTALGDADIWPGDIKDECEPIPTIDPAKTLDLDAMQDTDEPTIAEILANPDALSEEQELEISGTVRKMIDDDIAAMEAPMLKSLS